MSMVRPMARGMVRPMARAMVRGVGGSVVPGALGKAVLNLGGGEIVPANFINVFHALVDQVIGSDQTDLGRLDEEGYPVSTLTAGVLMGPASGSSEAWATQYKLAWPAGRSTWKLFFQAGGCTIDATSGSPTTTGGTGGNMTVQPTPGVAGYVLFTAAPSSPGLDISSVFSSVIWPAGAFYGSGSGEIACYRVSDEAAYLAGEYFTPEFIDTIADLAPRSLRPMGWVNGGASNLNGETTWAHRIQPSHRSWRSQYHPGVWGGAIAGTNTYTGSAAPDTPGSWTDGERWTGIIANANSTSTPTLNIGSRGAKTIVNAFAGALSNGDLAANTAYTFTYDAILDKLLVSVADVVGYALPWEAQIELCNQIEANFFATIPFSASDDYVTNLTTLVRDNLSTSLLFEPEYSNEVWNFQFPQTGLARARGTAFGWSDSSNENVYGWYALRAREIMGDLIPAVFSGAMNRVSRVLAYQGGGDITTDNQRFSGAQLTPATANAAYDTYTGGADYSTKPDRPIDVVEAIAYAPYAGGTLLCYGPDNDLYHTPNPATEAAGTQAIVDAWDAGDTATAIRLVDEDIRAGRAGVQNVTASGTTFTTPLAHGYQTGETVWFDAMGGTLYSGVTFQKMYEIVSVPTTTTFTVRDIVGNNGTGSAINAGSAGSGTMRVGTTRRTMLEVSKMRLFSEILASIYDGDRPSGMADLEANDYEGSLEPVGPNESQCTTLGLTGDDPAASIAAAIEAWRNDSAAMFTQDAYFRSSMGTYATDTLTFGQMNHATAPANLVLSGGGVWGILSGYMPNSTRRRTFDGFSYFSQGNAPPVAAPSAFTSGMWTVASGGASVTLLTVPDKNGSDITAVNYRVNAGSWQSLGATAAGTYAITATVGDDIELQAVNAVGSSAAGDSKTVVSGSYDEKGALFGGAAYLTRTSALTGAVPSKTGLVFASVDVIDADSYGTIIHATTFAQPTLEFYVSKFGSIYAMKAFDVSASGNIDLATGGAGNGRVSLLSGLDADGISRLMLFNGTSWSELASDATGGGTNLSWDRPDWSIFADNAGSPRIANLKAYRVAVWAGLSVPDVTDSAVQDLFVDAATGKTVDPSFSVAAFGTPLIDMYGTAADWSGTNHGSGGAFTLTGTPTDV